jgi:hypothetical protein
MASSTVARNMIAVRNSEYRQNGDADHHGERERGSGKLEAASQAS